VSLSTRINTAIDAISSVAVIVAAVALVWAMFFRQPAATKGPQVESVDGGLIDAERARHQFGKGSIAIVEFADFQCPFCSEHATDTLPNIRTQLIESGKARYVALHYPLKAIHPHAEEAAVAAECAAIQGRFWEMHGSLFAHSVALARGDLLRYADELKLNTAEFGECLDRQEVRDAVQADREAGTRLGVMGTPTFFLGTVREDGSIELVKRIRGVAPVDVFAKELEGLVIPT
jgi:protein-disulfide isomerase